MQPLVAQYIQFFQGPGRKWFRKWMSRSTRYIPVMQPMLEQHGLPRDTVYLAMIESGFSRRRHSWAHAAGPWQFISSTGSRYGLRQDFWVDERRDPLKATVAAGSTSRAHKEPRPLVPRLGRVQRGRRELRRMVQKRGTADFWRFSDGKGLAKETKHYVPKLIACALIAKHPSAFGFSEDEFEFEQPLESDEVPLVDATDLDVLARAAGDRRRAHARAQPRAASAGARRRHPRARPYLLRVPKGTRDTVRRRTCQHPRLRAAHLPHPPRSSKGDTLSRIALHTTRRPRRSSSSTG